MQAGAWPQLGWDGHVLLVYATEGERRAGVVGWLRRGLGAGAKIVYVESDDMPAERSLAGVLSESQIDVSGALARGQLQVVDPICEGVGVAWQSAVVDEGLGAGYPTVRLGGDVSAIWSAMSEAEHVDTELAAEELCRTRPASILCQYSAGVPQPALQRACALHATGIRESKLRTAPVVSGLALIGQVDASNQELVSSALSAVCERERGTIDVDLTRLDFLDVAGARALLLGSMAYRDRGGAVRLRGSQPTVGRLLRLLGVDGAAGVILEDTS